MTWLRSMGSPTCKQADNLLSQADFASLRFARLPEQDFSESWYSIVRHCGSGRWQKLLRQGRPTSISQTQHQTCTMFHRLVFTPLAAANSEAFLQHCNAAGYLVSEQMEQAG